MFARRSLFCRYATIFSAVMMYGLLFIGINQFQQSPVISDDLETNQALQQPSASVVKTTSRDDGGPTPAAVAAALRSPLGVRGEESPGSSPDSGASVAKSLEKSMLSPSSQASTTLPVTKSQQQLRSSTTKKNGAEAAELNVLHSNMTLHKANISDVLRHVKAAIDNDVDVKMQAKGERHHDVGADVDEKGKKVVNPHPFKYIINNPNACRDQDIYILAYVHTAPDHYKRRIVIRQTWGAASNYDFNMRVIFVMGRPADNAAGRAIQNALEFEAEQYGDIVQEDFLDTYRNLTYKGIAALKWIEERCAHARWILKTDDDIFVNTFNLIRHLRRMERLEAEELAAAESRHVTLPTNSTHSTHGLLMCLVWYNMVVMRDGKWKVEKSDWPEDTYPTYCSGSAFVMSTDTAIALHRVSYNVPFFWVDDFYVTGLLALRAGRSVVRHVQFASSYLLDGRQLANKFTGTQWYQYVFSHVHDLNAIQAVWKAVVRISRGEVAPTIAVARPDELPKYARLAEEEEEKKKPKPR